MTNHYFFVAVKDTNESVVSNIYVFIDDKEAIDIIGAGVHSVAERAGDKLLLFEIYKICGNLTERVYHE